MPSADNVLLMFLINIVQYTVAYTEGSVQDTWLNGATKIKAKQCLNKFYPYGFFMYSLPNIGSIPYLEKSNFTMTQ